MVKKTSLDNWMDEFLGKRFDEDKASQNSWFKRGKRKIKWLYMIPLEDPPCFCAHGGSISLKVSLDKDSRIDDIEYSLFYIDNMAGGHTMEIQWLEKTDIDKACNCIRNVLVNNSGVTEDRT